MAGQRKTRDQKLKVMKEKYYKGNTLLYADVITEEYSQLKSKTTGKFDLC